MLAQLRRGVIEYCVLASLADGPSYGQHIARTLGADRTLFDAEGTLYPLLARLRQRGWVETTWQESPLGPPRRYYALTRDGRAALAAFAAVWAPFSAAVASTMKGTDA